MALRDSATKNSPLRDIEAKLGTKRSFETALKDLEHFVLRTDSSDLKTVYKADLQHVLKRVIVLLRSRYSSVTFWSAAREAFLAIQPSTADSTELRAQIEEYLRECQRFLQSQSPSLPSNVGSLFEGQLTNEAATPAEQPPVQTYEQILSQLFQNGFSNSSNTGTQQTSEDLQISEETLRELEDQQVAALTAAGLLQDARSSKAPPASRRAIKQLKQIMLTKEGIATLRKEGSDAACSICREDFGKGDTMQIMPCSSHHAFHPPCLKPWLQENNSCPICRYELETDDLQYEIEKLKRLQDEIDQKGAANALSHNEFLYI